MMLPGKRVQDDLQRIKKTVEMSHEYFRDNAKRFNEAKEFIFKSTITKSDEDNLKSLDLPVLRFNAVEPYISRLRGEFADNHPDLKLLTPNSQDISPQTIEVLGGLLRHIMYVSDAQDIDNEIINNMLGGGYHVIKLHYDYEHDNTFDQELILQNVYDPTLCGFDPMSRKKHKGDGRYCWELYPKRLEELLKEFPNARLKDEVSQLPFIRVTDEGLNWSWSTDRNDKMLYVCEYWEKVYKTKHLVEVVINGQTQVMEKKDYEEIFNAYDQSQPFLSPEIIKEETRQVVDRVDRYIMVGNKVLKYDQTIYKELPLVFFDGNGQILKGKHYTRSYAYNAMDIQRARNLLGNQFLDEVQNIRKTTIIAPIAALPEDERFREAYLCPAKATAALVYNHEYEDPTTKESREIPMPQVLPRTPIPPELWAGFQSSSSEIQVQLGAYDAALGINNNQLSGDAIIAGGTQANAAAKPCMINYVASMNHLAKMIIGLIPKIYTTPRSVPVVNKKGQKTYQPVNQPGGTNLKYEPNSLRVIMEEGANYQIQRQQAIEALVNLSTAFPMLGQIINSQGLEIVLDNIEINGVDQLKEMVEKQMQTPPPQPPPNPDLIRAQNDVQKTQMDAQLESQKLQIEKQRDLMKFIIEKTKLAQEAKFDQQDLSLEVSRQHLEQMNQAFEALKFNAEKQHDMNKFITDKNVDLHKSHLSAATAMKSKEK